MDEAQGLELTEGNIETVLDEIRPYLVGKTICAADVVLPNKACLGWTCTSRCPMEVECRALEIAGT